MRIYKKFSTADLNVLEESFKRHSFYPSKIKIKKLAKSLTTNFSKIENWFKYKRRKMYFCGKFSDYKIRKIFTMEENNYLDTIFLQNRKPNYQKCKEISTHLPDISSYQIKNWFSNRRRKMRNEKKRLGGLKRETKSKRKHQLCNEKKEKNPTFKQKIAVKQSDATVIEVKTIEPPKLESNVLLKVEENIKKCESQDECQFKKEIAYNMQFSHKNSLFKESNYPNYLKSNMVQNQFFSNNQVMNFINYQNIPNSYSPYCVPLQSNFQNFQFLPGTNLNITPYVQKSINPVIYMQNMQAMQNLKNMQNSFYSMSGMNRMNRNCGF